MAYLALNAALGLRSEGVGAPPDADRIGEGGMHGFLKDLQKATAETGVRIHLMGHSFGTIVVSGMLGGPNGQGVLPRPVKSVALVQGAVSQWCYAPKIPFPDAGKGRSSQLARSTTMLSAYSTLLPLASAARLRSRERSQNSAQSGLSDSKGCLTPSV
jgi:hypothetical protein